MKLLKKLMPKDSFYLVLFICIATLGASAVWVSKEEVKLSREQDFKNKLKEEEIKLDLNEKEITKNDIKEKADTIVVIPKREAEPKPEPVPTPEPEPKVEPAPKPKVETKPEVKPEVTRPKEVVKQEKPVEKKEVKVAEKPVKVEEKAESVASAAVEVKQEKLKKPVGGSITKDYSKDKLVYSKTLDEWSVHLGIDIAASEGTDVLAPLDGIVKHIRNDQNIGIMITLDHGNGLETIYKNISTDKMVKVGQQVKTGEAISKVSKGIGFEKLDAPHLHFEVLKSGVSVDPKKYF